MEKSLNQIMSDCGVEGTTLPAEFERIVSGHAGYNDEYTQGMHELIRKLTKRVQELEAERLLPWKDTTPTPEDEKIMAAHPVNSEDEWCHDVWVEAMRLVGARHSKGSLVALVNCLLSENRKLRAKTADARW